MSKATREGRWPTPEEFVDEWEALDHAARLAQADRIIGSLQRSSECIVRNHASLELECEHLRAVLVTARNDAIEEFAAKLSAGLSGEADQ